MKALASSVFAAEQQSRIHLKIEKLIDLVKGKSARQLRSFLDREVEELNLMAIEDERGYSLLHLAAFKKFSSDFESILLDAIKKK